MMVGTSSPYGWFGKVPCVGDFVRSGLSPLFVDGWDRWMQALLLDGAAVLGERWLPCYLSAPIWRFALPPGICGPRAAAGIMMPSVDRVGRRFPLCLAQEIDASAWTAYRTIEPDFAPLVEAAMAMLEDDATLGHLEEALAVLPKRDPVVHSPVSGMGAGIRFVERDTHEQALAAMATDTSSSVWVTPFEGRKRVLLTQGMPGDPEAAWAFFDLQAPFWAPETKRSRHNNG